MVAAILPRLMELKVGQVEGASWEAPKAEAREQLERWILVILGPGFALSSFDG